MRREQVEARDMPPEQMIGRTAPPSFMFDPVSTLALAGVEGGAGLACKILSISAPVGYGKTVLISRLLTRQREAGCHCIWLTLDERDDTIENVLTSLESLLERRVLNEHPAHALFRGQDSVDRRVAALVDAANRYPQPLILFLDNLHFCTDAACARLLDKLAFATRPSVQLVLSSVRDIPLDVSRAQLQGLIRQIGVEDLSFNESEVAALLGPDLVRRIGDKGVSALTQRTEGWPAAIRMAQIILSNAADPSRALENFSGSDQTLAQLLNRQVLQGFPADVRDFLLKIALLRTFNVELCEVAVGHADVQARLAYVIDHNVFVIPLDRHGQAYRLHGLFRDFLLREGERVLSRQSRAAILQRAAQWCQQHGEASSAVEYALASGDASITSEILEHIAPEMVRDRGQAQQYIQWMEALHTQGHQAGPEAEYWFAWALTFYRRYEYARHLLTQLAGRMRRQAAETGDASRDLQRRIDILRTSIDSLSDRINDAHQGAAHWLSGIVAGQDHPFNITAAHCIESGYFSSALRFVEARQAIQSAREAAFQTHSAYVDTWVNTYAALIPLREGDYASAFADLKTALELARSLLGNDAASTGTMAVMAARCAIEMGRLDEGRQLLESGLPNSRTHGFLEVAACGLEAAVVLWSDEAGEFMPLAQLRDIASAYAPRLSLMLSCYLIQRLLVLGRLSQAQLEAEHIGLMTGPVASLGGLAPVPKIAVLDVLFNVTRIRLLLWSGQYKQAEPLIEEALRLTKSHGCVADQVELLLSAATLAARAGEPSLAVRHITRAVSLAANRGIVRPFHDHAEALACVVGETKLSAWGFATQAERDFFAALCRALPFSDPRLADKLSALTSDDELPATQLTSREHELLGYIEVGFSNQQIADRIDVSLTTVKWHLQNLYAKLSVKNRSAALARARVLNLLQR
jgi:LuxR family maltose regulon positive regulatory protein